MATPKITDITTLKVGDYVRTSGGRLTWQVTKRYETIPGRVQFVIEAYTNHGRNLLKVISQYDCDKGRVRAN